MCNTADVLARPGDYGSRRTAKAAADGHEGQSRDVVVPVVRAAREVQAAPVG